MDGVIYVMLYTEHLYWYHHEEIEKLMKENKWTFERSFGQITDKCEYSTYYDIYMTKELFEDNGFQLIDHKPYRGNWKTALFRIYKFKKVKDAS